MRRPGAVLGSSWAILGPSWEPLGSSWGRLGAVLGRLGAVMGRLRGGSWGPLGPSWMYWGCFGAVLEGSREILLCLWVRRQDFAHYEFFHTTYGKPY